MRPVAVVAPVLGFLVLWPATVPTASAPQQVAGDFVTQAGLSGVEQPPLAPPPPAEPPAVTPPSSSSVGEAVLGALPPDVLAKIKDLLGLPASSSGQDVLDALIKLSAPQPPGSAETLGLQTLSFGSTGPEVALVQALLAANGISTGPVDGIVGPLTEAAVRAFQEAHGLLVDGIVGAQTLAALFKTLT